MGVAGDDSEAATGVNAQGKIRTIRHTWFAFRRVLARWFFGRDGVGRLHRQDLEFLDRRVPIDACRARVKCCVRRILLDGALVLSPLANRTAIIWDPTMRAH